MKLETPFVFRNMEEYLSCADPVEADRQFVKWQKAYRKRHGKEGVPPPPPGLGKNGKKAWRKWIMSPSLRGRLSCKAYSARTLASCAEFFLAAYEDAKVRKPTTVCWFDEAYQAGLKDAQL